MNYYVTNFTLMELHKYSLTELEEMYPLEREIYISLLNKHIQAVDTELANVKSKLQKPDFSELDERFKALYY
mgnify:CR=1 FL=1